MLNRFVVMGRITKDLELRQTTSGIPVLRFSIACNREKKQENGETKADFFDCVAWRNKAEFISRYFSKGRMIAIEGRLYNDEWTDRDGNKRRTCQVEVQDVYFCGDSQKSKTSSQESTQDISAFEDISVDAYDLPSEFDDGDLPF